MYVFATWAFALLLARTQHVSAQMTCGDIPGSGCDQNSLIVDPTMTVTLVRCGDNGLSWGSVALAIPPVQNCIHDFQSTGSFSSLCSMFTEKPLPPDLTISFPGFDCADFVAQCCSAPPTGEPTSTPTTAEPTARPIQSSDPGLVLTPGELIGIVLSVVLGVPAIVFPLLSWFRGMKTSAKLDEVGEDVHAIEVVTAEPVVVIKDSSGSS